MTMKPHVSRESASFTLAQLARRWRAPVRIVRGLLREGTLLFEQVRGQLRVPREEVLRYERSNGQPESAIVKKSSRPRGGSG